MARSREIFDSYIMKELLACSHVSAPTDRAGQGRQLTPLRVHLPLPSASPSRRVPLSMCRATW